MSRIEYLKTIGKGELTYGRILTAVKNRLYNVPILLNWLLNETNAKRSKKILKSYKDKYKGKRCFVVANGPSLKKTDLSFLKDEITFGMNRIFLTTPETGFSPTFLACIDIETMLKQFPDEMGKAPFPKFYNYKARNLFSNDNDICFVKLGYQAGFHTDLVRSCWGGHSVAFVCLQLAYYMGFSEVYLIGKDHSYKGQGYPGQFIKATGKEDNHFIKGYFKKGDGWKIPDYKGEELAYQMAKEAFEKDGRIIKDATIGGQLEVFDKVNYERLFS